MAAAFPSLPLRRQPLLLWGSVFALSFAAAGCAQQRDNASYYDLPAESSVTDSQNQAQGGGYRSTLRAPSQLQIALKPDARTPNQQAIAASQAQTDGESVVTAANESPNPARRGGSAAATAQPVAATAPAANEPAVQMSETAARLVPQAHTYLGTLPCFGAGMQCTGQRLVLTLAPNGRWRARSSYLNQSAGVSTAKPITEQGCWDATDEKPPRVMLLDNRGNMRAEFVVTANNVLRVRAIDGTTPNLSYNLTRQPDLDAIDELNGQPAPACK
ncbi:MAG: copper resistance protein NlpE N-terminal domain-containing protein [Achromobacter sp.]